MKKLEDYKKDYGYEYEECWHDDAESLLQTGILGFCGCGLPDGNLLYVLGGLELIDEQSPEGGRGVFDAWLAAYKARVLKHFGSDESAYFFYYWADKEGFTEHGGSVPGWLSDKGIELLAMLREWQAANRSK